jgi:hypothetical protein
MTDFEKIIRVVADAAVVIAEEFGARDAKATTAEGDDVCEPGVAWDGFVSTRPGLTYFGVEGASCFRATLTRDVARGIADALGVRFTDFAVEREGRAP